MSSSSISKMHLVRFTILLFGFALEHHHVPAETIELIMSQYNYSGFFLNVPARKCGLQTGPIHFQRGVIQGDTLSPLLVNLVLDSLM